LDKGVGAHEAACQGVVDAPVHVDDAHLVQVFMQGASPGRCSLPPGCR
jgi:hypothetical protein